MILINIYIWSDVFKLIIFTDMENVTNRLSSNSIQVSYQYSNGNQPEDEHFEDADWTFINEIWFCTIILDVSKMKCFKTNV